jgi:hypothetical protein
MNESNNKLPISDLEALLPWHAAGTLDPDEAAEVEKALASEPELARRLAMVREEMAETILTNEALGAPSARAMQNLFKAIDQERKVVRREAGASGGLAAWFADLFSPRAFAFTAAAAVVIVLLQAGVIAKLVTDEHTGASFETASAPPAGGATRGISIGSFALMRFAPQASIGEVTRFLDSHDAVIVDGPRPGGPAGMYKVRVSPMRLARPDLDALLKDFQASSKLVTFAAPTE